SAMRRYSDPPSAYIPGFFALRTLRLVSLFSGRAIVPIFAHIRNVDTDRRQPTSQDRDRKKAGDLYEESALPTAAAGRSWTRSSGKRWNAQGPTGTQRGADRGSGLVPVSRGLCGKRERRIVRRSMQPQLFLPTARQTNWLLLLALLSLGEAL